MLIAHFTLGSIIICTPLLICILCIICIPFTVLTLTISRRTATNKDLNNLLVYKYIIIDDDKNELSESRTGLAKVVGIGNFSKKKYNDIKINSEDAICCICADEYEKNNKLRVLNCGHHFHKSCCDKWLIINSTCPICRNAFNYSSNNNLSEIV